MLGLIDFWLTLAKHLLEKIEEDFAPKWGNLYATAQSWLGAIDTLNLET